MPVRAGNDGRSRLRQRTDASGTMAVPLVLGDLFQYALGHRHGIASLSARNSRRSGVLDAVDKIQLLSGQLIAGLALDVFDPQQVLEEVIFQMIDLSHLELTGVELAPQ